MTDRDCHPSDELNVTLLRRIDAVCSQFEQQWRDQKSPQIEDFLQQIPEQGRSNGLCELIAAEVALRLESGAVVDIQSYVARFPDKEQLVRRAFAMPKGIPAPERCGTETKPYEYPPAKNNSGDTPVEHRQKAESADQRLPERIGRFSIDRELGRGSYGIVYLATDPLLGGRKVALKVPRDQPFQCEEDRREFIRDAEFAARLNHPGIVTIYHVEAESDPLFIVQEYMQGGDLKQRLKSGVTCEQAVAWMIPIAEAVAFAHQYNTFHRDLKPANILLTERGEPRVADFGLALHENDQQWHRNEFAGTLPYMSPEQVRRESNRLSGRSDTWSLGVMFYEMLTGERPFRGTTEELIDQIKYHEPRPPRERKPSLPIELERICLKCLAKLAVERYSSAADLAQDLLNWQESQQRSTTAAVQVKTIPARVVPRGLRAFDARDSDFFLNLLPGPRDRDGLPENVRFFKQCIEETDPERTFAVGVLHGPSGCGKSSLIKAGLLPHLTDHILPVLIEATFADTEVRLLKSLRRSLPDLPRELPLPELFVGLRSGRWNPHGKKILIVLDQFEQWLQGRTLLGPVQLVDALRHFDGEHLQCLVLIREDFWTGISRFMRTLEIPLQEQRNSVFLDRFDPRHAGKVLEEFGRAFGQLPERPEPLSDKQREFLEAAVSQLSDDDGKVICVRLALFGDMIKAKSWTRAALDQAGGAQGLGVTFLEDTFAAKSAPEVYRRHEKAVRRLFGELLPDSDSNIKGSMKSREDLARACGYAEKPEAFEELLQILDEQLRLVTPTDPEGLLEFEPPAKVGPAKVGPSDNDSNGLAQYYQFTHDYLVPSVRKWLNLKRLETRPGRAAIRLEERALLWNSKSESRHLPSLWEFLSIWLLTERNYWTAPQQKMMRTAARKHATRTVTALLLLIVGLLGIFEFSGRRNARNLIGTIQSAETTDLPRLIGELAPYRRWADPMLKQIADSPTSTAKQKLHVNLALVADESTPASSDPTRIDYLFEQLLDARPSEVAVIRDFLWPQRAELSERLWQAIEHPADRRHRLRAAAALAVYEPNGDRWNDYAADVAYSLASVQAFETRTWTDYFVPIGTKLAGELETIYKDRREERTSTRPVAAAALAEYLRAVPGKLVALALWAENEQEFFPFVEQLRVHSEQAESLLDDRLRQSANVNSTIEDRDADWKQKATAAVCLLQLGKAKNVWPLLKASPDRSLQSFLVERLHALGTPWQLVEGRLAVETDVSAQQQLILCLGDFDALAIAPSDRNAVIERLLVWRLHRDSGIHSAAEWTLQKWGVTLPPLPHGSADHRHWEIVSPQQTMLVVRGPVEFLMSSATDENEKQSKPLTLTSSFALGAREVTVRQFQMFRKHREPVRQYAPDDECPMNSLSWYDAVEYCNWLNVQQDVPKSEWCYEPNENGEYAEGMTIAADCLQRTGFRLPTEAEWFYVCKANSTTNYSFGEPLELTSRYAWYYSNSFSKAGEQRSSLAGSLRPNALGAFDMDGNVWEWCHDVVSSTNRQATTSIDDNARCLLRGGSFLDLKNRFRAAGHTLADVLPNDGSSNYGFRVARTLR